MNIKRGPRGSTIIRSVSWWIVMSALMLTSPLIHLSSSDESSSDSDDEKRSKSLLRSIPVSDVVECDGFNDEFMDSIENQAETSTSVIPYTPPSDGAGFAGVQKGIISAAAPPENIDLSTEPVGLDLQFHFNLQDLARKRQRPYERRDYYLTAHGHPFGPCFLYPVSLPLFGGYGGLQRKHGSNRPCQWRLGIVCRPGMVQTLSLWGGPSPASAVSMAVSLSRQRNSLLHSREELVVRIGNHAKLANTTSNTTHHPN